VKEVANDVNSVNPITSTDIDNGSDAIGENVEEADAS